VADSAPHVERREDGSVTAFRVHGRKDQGAALHSSTAGEKVMGLLQDLGRFPTRNAAQALADGAVKGRAIFTAALRPTVWGAAPSLAMDGQLPTPCAVVSVLVLGGELAEQGVNLARMRLVAPRAAELAELAAVDRSARLSLPHCRQPR